MDSTNRGWDHVILEVFTIEEKKNPCISGPTPLKLVLFEGQLYMTFPHAAASQGDTYVWKCACLPTFSSNLSRKLKSVAGPGRIHSSSYKTETEVSVHGTTLHQFQV